MTLPIESATKATLLDALAVIENVAHGNEPRRKPLPTESVAARDRCPTCGRRYEFVTTGPFGIGLIKPVHPVGRCVPPAPVVYETDEEEKPQRRKSRRNTVPTTKVCAWEPCGKPFTTIYYAMKTCSSECGRKRLKAYRHEYFLNREVRKYIRRTKRAA